MSADVTGSETAFGKAEPPVIKPLTGWSPEITPVDKPWFAADEAPRATAAAGGSQDGGEEAGGETIAQESTAEAKGDTPVTPSKVPVAGAPPGRERAESPAASREGEKPEESTRERPAAGRVSGSAGRAEDGARRDGPAGTDSAARTDSAAGTDSAARTDTAAAEAGGTAASTDGTGHPRMSRRDQVRREPRGRRAAGAAPGAVPTPAPAAPTPSPAAPTSAPVLPPNPAAPTPATLTSAPGAPAPELVADLFRPANAANAADPVPATPVAAKPAATKPVDAKPAAAKPVDAKPAAAKPVDAKPAAAEPADAKPADAAVSEAVPVDATVSDAEPVDGKPVDGKPVDGKPVDETPDDETPVDERPAEPNRADLPTASGSLFEPSGEAAGTSAQPEPESPFPRPPSTPPSAQSATPPSTQSSTPPAAAAGPRTSPFGLPAASPLPGFGRSGLLSGGAAASGVTADLPAVVINPAPVFDADPQLPPPLPPVPSSGGAFFAGPFAAPTAPVPPTGPVPPAARTTPGAPGIPAAAGNDPGRPAGSGAGPGQPSPGHQGPGSQGPGSQGPAAPNQFPTIPFAPGSQPTTPLPPPASGEGAAATQASWYSDPLFTEEQPRQNRWTTAAVVGGAIAVGVLIYIVLAFLLTRSVPDGTVVGGLQIGGLSHDEAVAKVQERVDAVTAGGVPVLAGDSEEKLSPSAAGLTTDAETLVDGLAGFSLDPRALWRHVAGSAEVESTDPARLTAAIEKLAAKTDKPAKDATVLIRGTSAVVKDGEQGQAVDVPAAVRAVSGAWLAGGTPITLPTRSTEPAITQGAAERSKIDQVEPALAAPLRIVLDQRSVRLQPKDFASSLSVVAGDTGNLELAVDGEKLRKIAVKKNPDLEVPAKDATVVIKKGKPKIVKGVTGRGLSVPSLAEEARAALAGDRIAIVEPATVQPKLTTDDVKALGIVERTSTFATNLTANAGRTENLRIAARAVNNTLVLPGETFSLNEVLGERTAAKGYNAAPAINNGRLVMDHGGGVSQMATTIFNNVFFSGLEDVYHKPHSFYISRYPVGREATVNWPTVDLKWKNDSPYGVLIQAWVDDQVHVSFWSTKVWDIKSITGSRTNYRTPKTIYDESDGCVSQVASPGFDIQVTRVFKKDGKEVKRQTFSTTYIAEDRVICGPDPDKPKTRPTTGPGAGSESGSGGSEDDAPTG